MNRDRIDQIISLLLLIMFAANLFYIWKITESSMSVDAPYYIDVAKSLKQGQGYPGMYRTPVYPLLLVPFLSGDGVHLRALAFFQTLLIFLAGILLFATIRLFVKKRSTCALVAAFALSQFQIISTAQLVGTEAISVFLMCMFCYFIGRLVLTKADALYPITALSLALLALTRPQYYLLTPLVFLLLLYLRPKLSAWKNLAAFALILMVFLGGWALRNGLAFGLFSPSDSLRYGLEEYLVSLSNWVQLEQASPELVSDFRCADNSKQAMAALLVIVDQETKKDGSPSSDNAKRQRFLMAEMKNTLRQPGAKTAFIIIVAQGAKDLLGVSASYWQSKTVIATMRHHSGYYRIFQEVIQEFLDVYHPWIFCCIGLLLIPILIFGKKKTDLHRLIAFIWITMGMLVISAAVVDIPNKARYSIAMTPMFALFYCLLAKYICDLNRTLKSVNKG